MYYVIISIIIFVASAIAGMTGIGGGTMFVPALLLMKYSFHEATTISLFLIAATGISALLQYRKAHLVDWKLAMVVEIFTDMGAFTGGFTSVNFHPFILKILFSVVLIVIAFITIKVKPTDSGSRELKKGFGYWLRNFNGMSYSIPLFYMIPVTFAAGYLSGLLGIGGGVIKIPMMILWFGIPAKVAVATSALMVSFTALTGLGGHLIHTQIDWSLAIILAVVAFIGGRLGSRFSMKLSESKVKTIVGIVFIAVAIIMAVQTIVSGG
jgi:uncharacterized protein